MYRTDTYGTTGKPVRAYVDLELAALPRLRFNVWLRVATGARVVATVHDLDDALIIARGLAGFDIESDTRLDAAADRNERRRKWARQLLDSRGRALTFDTRQHFARMAEGAS